MFVRDNYILGVELASKMDIHVANISMMHKNLEDMGNSTDIVKIGNCTFINKYSIHLPNNIRKGIDVNTFTDVSGTLPITYLQSEFKLSKSKVMSLVNDPLHPEFSKILYIEDKILVKFSSTFLETVKNDVVVSITTKEAKEYILDGTIDGFIDLGSRSLSWYNV